METDVRKLQLGLATAALTLLAPNHESAEGMPFLIASQALDYKGAPDDNEALQVWLRQFINGPIAESVARD